MVLWALLLPNLVLAVTHKKTAAKRPVAVKRVVKKRTVAKRPLVRKTVVRKSVAARKRPARTMAARKPMNFATEPVQTELQSCSLHDGPLCLNCAEQALSTAKVFTGLRYVRGGTNPNVGFDCSGFVQHVYASSCGRQLPRRAQEQFEVGEVVDKADLKRGDLVFFRGRQGWHVGIFMGDNQFIHSPNRRSSIKISSLDAPYYKKSFKGARRIGTEIAPMVATDTIAFPAN